MLVSSLTITEKQKKAVVNEMKESSDLDENLEIKEEDIKEEPFEAEGGTTQRNKKARLIVRNLSFQVFCPHSICVILILTISL